MKISTKKWIYFASTVFGAGIMFMFFSAWSIELFGSCRNQYALFGSYKLYEYLDQIALLPLYFIPVSIFSIFYAHRSFKPHDQMTRIGVILNYFFLLGLITVFILSLFFAKVCFS